MNKLIWGFALILISFNAKSQDNNLMIIASGSGNSENNAINSALRNAIEKTFGVFISTSTTIQNDNLVSDDIASVSSGNIVSYQVIDKKTDGTNFEVTLSAILSPQKIVQSYKEKGSKEFELNGNVYQQNILKEKFYKDQEPIIIEEFFKKYESVRIFDTFNLKICEPFLYSEPVSYKKELEDYDYGNYLSSQCFFNSDVRGSQFYNCKPCNRKINETPHYAIPILYSPIFNKNTAIELSNALIRFFKSISLEFYQDFENTYDKKKMGLITDQEIFFDLPNIKNYLLKYGNVNALSLVFPINENGKIRTSKYYAFLRNSKSIAIINKYVNKFAIGSNVNSIYFDGFIPTLSSVIYQENGNNTITPIITTRTTYHTIKVDKYTEINFIDNITISEVIKMGGMNKRFEDRSFIYNPSLLLLEVTEEELGKLGNLKVLRNLN